MSFSFREKNRLFYGEKSNMSRVLYSVYHFFRKEVLHGQKRKAGKWISGQACQDAERTLPWVNDIQDGPSAGHSRFADSSWPEVGRLGMQAIRESQETTESGILRRQDECDVIFALRFAGEQGGGVE